MARDDFSGYVLINPSPDYEAPRFLTNAELKDLTDNPAESYGIQTFLTAIPDNPDPAYWGEGQAMLLKVRIATLEAVETVTKYEVRLADGG